VRSSSQIDIDASPELVFRLARDPLRWPDLLPHYARARAVDATPEGIAIVEFVARRVIVPVLGLGLPVAWRSRTWSEAATRSLRFQHLGGATAGMDVTWTIEPRSDRGTSRVTIEHVFSPRLGLWARFVDRWFIRPIAGRTLATFKVLAEAVDGIDESSPAGNTNPSS
jgi:polyketide cyclase/dehydrase/lipid transport protein